MHWSNKTKNKKIDAKNIFYVNSVFPHEIYKLSNSTKSRLIHFSTDCVFDGKKVIIKMIVKKMLKIYMDFQNPLVN